MEIGKLVLPQYSDDLVLFADLVAIQTDNNPKLKKSTPVCSMERCNFTTSDRVTMLEHMVKKKHLKCFFQDCTCLDILINSINQTCDSKSELSPSTLKNLIRGVLDDKHPEN